MLDGRNLRGDRSIGEKRMIDYEEYSELSKAYVREKFLREEVEKSLKRNATQYDLQMENIQLKKENEELREVISQMRMSPTSLNERSNGSSGPSRFNQTNMSLDKKIRFDKE